MMLVVFICVLLLAASAASVWEEEDLGSVVQEAIFVSGEEGYDTYRIPALSVTNQGTLLAFCEGRRNGRGDTGDIDLVLRRSEDGGATWGELQTVWGDFGPS